MFAPAMCWLSITKWRIGFIFDRLSKTILRWDGSYTIRRTQDVELQKV